MTHTDAVPISLSFVIRKFWGRIGVTWFIVLVENFLIALIPLFIGFSIDGLLDGDFADLALLAGVMILLAFVAVGRRIYDTRAYGAIRVKLGSRVTTSQRALDVSKRNACLDMSREIVDFLEQDVPDIITAGIQACVSLVVLAYFDLALGVSCAMVVVGMVAVYALFHNRFFRFNAALNAQKERQVDVLQVGQRRAIFKHLRSLRRHEVSLSDTEAVVYGGIFLLQIAFLVFNLHIGVRLSEITVGKIFSIATYSWEYVDAALALPLAMQAMTRLSEITQRLNLKD
jgi:ABC-type multidrug transport system fused ATPase/permease subunit